MPLCAPRQGHSTPDDAPAQEDQRKLPALKGSGEHELLPQLMLKLGRVEGGRQMSGKQALERGRHQPLELRARLLRTSDEESLVPAQLQLARDGVKEPLEVGLCAVVRLPLVARRRGAAGPVSPDLDTLDLFDRIDVVEDGSEQLRMLLVDDRDQRGWKPLELALDRR